MLHAFCWIELHTYIVTLGCALFLSFAFLVGTRLSLVYIFFFFSFLFVVDMKL